MKHRLLHAQSFRNKVIHRVIWPKQDKIIVRKENICTNDLTYDAFDMHENFHVILQRARFETNTAITKK